MTSDTRVLPAWDPSLLGHRKGLGTYCLPHGQSNPRCSIQHIFSQNENGIGRFNIGQRGRACAAFTLNGQGEFDQHCLVITKSRTKTFLPNQFLQCKIGFKTCSR